MNQLNLNGESATAEDNAEGPMVIYTRPGFFQRRQIALASTSTLSDEMVAAVVIGYSDLTGRIGMRLAWEMERMRRLFQSYCLLYSCVTVTGLSDEAIFLYSHAFALGLSPIRVQDIVTDYQLQVLEIKAEYDSKQWLRRRLLVGRAYRGALLKIAQTAYAAA